MMQNNFEQAIGLVEKILTWVNENGLSGVHEPFLSYLRCYQVLNGEVREQFKIYLFRNFA